MGVALAGHRFVEVGRRAVAKQASCDGEALHGLPYPRLRPFGRPVVCPFYDIGGMRFSSCSVVPAGRPPFALDARPRVREAPTGGIACRVAKSNREVVTPLGWIPEIRVVAVRRTCGCACVGPFGGSPLAVGTSMRWMGSRPFLTVVGSRWLVFGCRIVYPLRV